MSKDPLSGDVLDPSTLNPYVYAKDNPLTLADPGGQWVIGIGLGLVGGSGAYASYTAFLCFAEDGTVGIIASADGGTMFGTSISIGVQGLISLNAHTLKDLEGPYGEVGGSVVMGEYGANGNLSFTRNSAGEVIATLTGGPGAGAAAEFHVGGGWTWLLAQYKIETSPADKNPPRHWR